MQVNLSENIRQLVYILFFLIRYFHLSGERPLDFLMFFILLFSIYLEVTFLLLGLSKQFKPYVIAY